MTGSIYATVGYTCALVCLILFRCNRETPESSTEKYQNIRRDGGQFSYEIKIPAKTEEEQSRYLMADVKRVDLMDGSKVMVTCYSDITKRKMLEKKLRNLSDIDGLTGIANRRCGEKNIQLILHEKKCRTVLYAGC